MSQTSPIIISLGGSLIVPDDISTSFLRSFKKLIVTYIIKGYRFVLICGGGRTARRYQEAARSCGALTVDDVDWIGIHATRINAHLLRAIFKPWAHPQVIKNPTRSIRWRESVLVAAGWKPGCSTDYDAVLLAKTIGARRVINMTNIEAVYNKDPKKFKDAKKLARVSWKQYRTLIPKKWKPGLNTPFDPVASRVAEKLGLEVVIMDGENIMALKRCFDGKSFDGTLISNE